MKISPENQEVLKITSGDCKKCHIGNTNSRIETRGEEHLERNLKVHTMNTDNDIDLKNNQSLAIYFKRNRCY